MIFFDGLSNMFMLSYHQVQKNSKIMLRKKMQQKMNALLYYYD